MDSELRTEYERVAKLRAEWNAKLSAARGELQEIDSTISDAQEAYSEYQLVKADPALLQQNRQSKAFIGFVNVLGLVSAWLVSQLLIGSLWGLLVTVPACLVCAGILTQLLGFRTYRTPNELKRLIEGGRQAKRERSAIKEAVDIASKRFEEFDCEFQRLDSIRQEEVRLRQQEIADAERESQRHEAVLKAAGLREDAWAFQKAQDPQQVQMESTNKVDFSATRILGVGGEWLYAYSFASLMSEAPFPIKVGMTTREDVSARINEQMNATSMPERAKVLLLCKVDNSTRAERQIHEILSERGQRMDDAVGSEWFRTSEDELIELFRAAMRR